jgi:hypothetical protein
MKITAHIGETRDGLPLAELRDGDKVLAKLYPNKTGDKFRLVLPELIDYKQTLISPENHLIEFTRMRKP